MACPADVTFARLLEGGLSEAERGALQQHLDRCEGCRMLVAELARASEPSEGPSSPERSPAPFTGSGRYDILRCIGRGGMGEVYEAYDRRREEVVALKTLPALDAPGSDTAERVRLKAEFRRLADLRHPHLVPLYDLVVDGAQVFFTMARVAGIALDEAVAPLPCADGRRLRHLFRQLVEAVAALHDEGIVHRDIKPTNVLVTRDDHLVVLDFGLAVRWRRRTASRAGTPAYMAPEQAQRGLAQPASDFYAIGGCLHRCLIGEAPPVHPGRRAARPPVVAHGDEVLAGLCRALLAPDPRVRPTANEVRHALGVRPRSVVETAWVGREAELGRLRDALATRRPQLVVGPPGRGKTAFVEEALRRSGVQVLAARCRAREHVPFNALDGVVDDLVELLGQTVARDDHVAALAALFPTLSGDAPAPRATSPSVIRRRAEVALAELLERVSRGREVVVFVDDLQWADDESVELLTTLLGEGRGWSFVATARTGPAGEVLAPEALRPLFEPLSLAPLDDVDAADLLQRLGVEGDLDVLVATASGDPLWLRRLARAPRGASFEAQVEGQLEELAPSDRRLLEVAAIAETALPAERLGEAAGMDAGAARRRSEELVASALLRAEPPARAPRLEPFHDRIREVVADRVGDPASVHLNLARTLAQHITSRAELFACADHANAAFDRADDAATFARVNLRAARQARRATAHEGTVRYAEWGERWLARGEGDPNLRRELQRLALEGLFFGGQREAAAERRDRAIRGASWAERVEVQRHWTWMEVLAGDLHAALDAGRRALAELGHPVADPLPAPLLAKTLARTLGRSLDKLREAPACSPRGRAEMQVLGTMTPASFYLADRRLAAFITLRCLELSLDHGLAPESMLGIVGRGAVEAQLRRYHRVAAALEVARAVRDRVDHVPIEGELGLAGWLEPWGSPAWTICDRLQAREEERIAAGDSMGAARLGGVRIMLAVSGGMPLDEVEALGALVDGYAQGAEGRLAPALELLDVVRDGLDRLRGPPRPIAAATPATEAGRFYANLLDAVAGFHWGQIDDALHAILAAHRSRNLTRGQLALAMFEGYFVVISGEAARQGRLSRRTWLLVLDALDDLRRMARAYPPNFEATWLLARGEVWRAVGAASRARASYRAAAEASARDANLRVEVLARGRLAHCFGDDEDGARRAWARWTGSNKMSR